MIYINEKDEKIFFSHFSVIVASLKFFVQGLKYGIENISMANNNQSLPTPF